MNRLQLKVVSQGRHLSAHLHEVCSFSREKPNSIDIYQKGEHLEKPSIKVLKQEHWSVKEM